MWYVRHHIYRWVLKICRNGQAEGWTRIYIHGYSLWGFSSLTLLSWIKKIHLKHITFKTFLTKWPNYQRAKIVTVQLLIPVWLSMTPWTAAHQASLSITISQSLLKLMSTDSMMPYNHLILCCPLLLLPSILPSVRVFSNEKLFTSGGQRIGVSASASVLPMNIQDCPLGLTGWISLQSKELSRVLQHHSSKASILQCSAFFIVQLSHAYMTTGKNIALTRQTFVSKVMSLLFNKLSVLVIACLPRSKRYISFKKETWYVT